jgi:sterol 3beta-glucosyltransferase
MLVSGFEGLRSYETMRIAFLAAGSRGDIQPLLGLAASLRRQGQQIRFCAQAFYEPIVAAQKLEFFPLGGADPRKVWADAARDRPKTRLGRLWRVLNNPGPTLERLVQYEEACRSVDAIVCGTSSRAGIRSGSFRRPSRRYWWTGPSVVRA